MLKTHLVILKYVLFAVITIGIVFIAVFYRMENINGSIYKNQYKNLYILLSQATQRIIKDNGSPEIWATDAEHVTAMYKKYLFYKHHCVKDKSGCLLNKQLFWNNIPNEINLNLSKNSNFVLNNGLYIKFPELYNDKHTNNDNIYAVILPKADRYGKIPFFFVLKKDGIYPVKCNPDKICNVFRN